MTHRQIWPSYKKGNLFFFNLGIIVCVFFILAAVVSSVLLITNEKSINKEIQSKESLKNQKLCAQAETMFVRLFRIVSNFSTTILIEDSPEASLQVMRNLASHIVVENSINGIYVNYNGIAVMSGSVGNRGTMDRLDDYAGLQMYVSSARARPCVLQMVYEYIDDQGSTTVVLEVSVSGISTEIFPQGSESTGMEFVTDKDGRIIIASNPSSQYESLDDVVYASDGHLASYRENPSESYYISSNPITYMGLNVVTLIPKEQYAANINRQRLFFLVIGVVFFLLSIVTGYIVNVKTYRPIQNVMNTLLKYLPQSVTHAGNEVIFINDSITRILETNSTLEQETTERVETLRQSQLAALQAQINPHFLSNTLEAFKCLSIDLLDFGNPIEEGLVNLNNIIQASMEFSNLLIPLSEELTLTRRFISLMLLRYNQNFSVVWDVDDTLLDIPMLRFVIQPMVENAIRHGVSELASGGVVGICIYRQSEEVFIEVSDNGAGIDVDKLETLKRELQASNLSEIKHVGLCNINLRLKLLYGENYAVTLSSTVGKGTICRIKFPCPTLTQVESL